MKLIIYIKNLLSLWRENKKEKVDKRLNIENMFKVVKSNYTKKNSYIRNQTAKLIKKYRKEYPYKIKDYSKAKQFFESQPEPIQFDKIKKGDYVVKFTENYAIKGKRWCEYHICATSGEGTFKVGDWSSRWGYFSLYDYKGNPSSINDNDILMFRFATKQEIQEFKSRKKEYEEKKKEIKKLQKQINVLCGKL